MNKSPKLLLRSLSVFLSVSLLTGNIFAGNQTVFAETANEELDSDVDFISDADDTPDVEITEETPADTTENKSASSEDNNEVFSSHEENEELFTSGDSKKTSEEPDYILGRPMTDEERQEQLSLMPNLTASVPVEDADSDFSIATYSELPKTYDSREQGIVTSVKKQNPFGICWAFSLISNVETSLLSRGLGNWDLSEEHLAYFLSHRTDDPLGNTPNDRYIHQKNNYHDSGNGMVASFFLSTWSGMTTEDKVPLPTDSSHIQDLSASMVPDSSLAYDTSAYLENAVFSAYDVERTKLLISEYGSVSAMIYMDNTGKYYSPDTAASCYPNSDSVNHAITLVGWDDTYKKENFTATSGVQNNGAWIVKNSYGTRWGKDGYFYISYDDKSLRNLVCNTAVTEPAYPNNYFYDGATSSTVTLPLRTGYSIANIFTVKAGNGCCEELGEIVAASKADNSSYQIQIYTDLSDPSNPVSGFPAYDEPFEYTQALAGIDTVTLPEPVVLRPGSQFSVVLTLAGDPIPYYVEKSTDFGWMSVTAGIDAGQSFYSRNGHIWKDVSTLPDPYCFSIKAHTKTLDSEVTVTPVPTNTPIPTATPVPTATPTATPIPTATPVPRKYQVKYVRNTGLAVGNLPSDRSQYKSGQSVKIQGAPYCTSRFFTGWNTKADGSGTQFLPGQSFKIKQNTTLYAQWRVNYTSSASLNYRVTGKQTVTCYGTSRSSLRSAVIPATIKYAGITYKVTSVWTKAFSGKKYLSSVVIGNNVSAIGSQAFYNCKNLKSVTIGTGLTRISSGAFQNVKTKCIITVKSNRLSVIASQIDRGVKQMTVRVPKAKYSAYYRLLRAKSKSVIVRKF